MRNRITITLRDDIIKEADKLVNDLTIRSRSQAIEYLLSKTISNYQIESALILAGGPNSGFRDSPVHKTMQLVNGKPILENIIIFLKKNGIRKFVISCDNTLDSIKNYLSDGSKLDVEISYVTSEKPIGAAAAIKIAKNYFDRTFLVWYGDTLCKLDLAGMMHAHRDNNSVVTIALTTVSNPLNYGVVKMKGNIITDFCEKPQNKVAESFLVSSGIFIVEPEIFRYISSEMKSLESDLFPKLARKGLLIGYPFEGVWLNVNSKNDLQKANNLWKA
ncbi:MAG: sugar phosphate nucleotidyltransferase [Candidatus Aenigmatarchaeota archaeon]